MTIYQEKKEVGGFLVWITTYLHIYFLFKRYRFNLNMRSSQLPISVAEGNNNNLLSVQSRLQWRVRRAFVERRLVKGRSPGKIIHSS